MHPGDLELDLRLPGLRLEISLRGTQLLDRVVRDVERIEYLRLGDLVGTRLDHGDALRGAGHDQIEVGVLEQVLLVGVDDEVAVHLADPDRADGGGHRRAGKLQCGRSTVDREDVVRVGVIYRQRHCDQLSLVTPALGEERADRTVDHAGGESCLLAGPTLALEKGAGNPPGGVHALLDIYGEGEEVRVTEVSDDSGAQHHRVARAYYNSTGGLLGQLSGLERDLVTGDLDTNALHGVRHIQFPSAPHPRRSALLLIS